jgi:hypothetical protein
LDEDNVAIENIIRRATKSTGNEYDTTGTAYSASKFAKSLKKMG